MENYTPCRMAKKYVSLSQQKDAGPGKGLCIGAKVSVLVNPMTCAITVSSTCGKVFGGFAEGCTPGGSGGGTDTPVYDEEPCTTCPADGFVDGGDNTNEEPLGVTLDASMNHPANAKIKCVWEKLKQIPAVKAIINGYGSFPSFRKLKIEVKAPIMEQAEGETKPVGYDTPTPNLNDIVVTIHPKMVGSSFAELHIAEVIIHELMHARWYSKEAEFKYENPTLGLSDMPAFAPHIPRYGLDRNSIQHECIAQTNVQELTRLLAKYDGNPNGGTVGSMYEMVAWGGSWNTAFYDEQRFPNKLSKDGQTFLAQQFLNSKLGTNPCQ